MPFAISPAITAAIAIALFGIGLGGGALLMHWKASGTIEKLQGNNNQLTDANGRCAADIKSAQTAMQAMTAVSQERERQAQESMQQAQPQVERHIATITRIKAMPSVPIDMQCEAIRLEQIEYVKRRRSE